MIKDPIKLAIRKKGLSQGEFAEQIGISRMTLHSLLSGKNLPKGPTLDKIAKGLGWSRRRLGKLLVDMYSDRANGISNKHNSAGAGGASAGGGTRRHG